MHYKIRKLKTVGLRQGAPTVSAGWNPMALRKTARAMGGLAILILGVVLIFLPSPSVLVIALGLAILALEFPWTKGIVDWSRDHVRRSWIVVRDRLAQLA